MEKEKMTIYEVNFKEKDGTDHSVYFSSQMKTNSFVAKNKKYYKEIIVTVHGVGTTKPELITFLNRENKIG